MKERYKIRVKKHELKRDKENTLKHTTTGSMIQKTQSNTRTAKENTRKQEKYSRKQKRKIVKEKANKINNK